MSHFYAPGSIKRGFLILLKAVFFNANQKAVAIVSIVALQTFEMIDLSFKNCGRGKRLCYHMGGQVSVLSITRFFLNRFGNEYKMSCLEIMHFVTIFCIGCNASELLRHRNNKIKINEEAQKTNRKKDALERFINVFNKKWSRTFVACKEYVETTGKIESERLDIQRDKNLAIYDNLSKKLPKTLKKRKNFFKQHILDIRKMCAQLSQKWIGARKIIGISKSIPKNDLGGICPEEKLPQDCAISRPKNLSPKLSEAAKFVIEKYEQIKSHSQI